MLPLFFNSETLVINKQYNFTFALPSPIAHLICEYWLTTTTGLDTGRMRPDLNYKVSKVVRPY